MPATVGTTNFAEYAGSTTDPVDVTNVVVDSGANVFVFQSAHNVNAGSNLAGVILDPAGANQALTNRIDIQDGSFLVRYHLWDRDSPTAGTITMRIDMSNTTAIRGAWAVANLSGLDTGALRGTTATTNGTGTSTSVDPASDDANDISLGGLAVAQGNHDPVQSTGTNIANGEDLDNTANDNHTSYALGYRTGTGSVDFTWTSGVNNAFAAGAQSYNGSVGSSGNTVDRNFSRGAYRGLGL